MMHWIRTWIRVRIRVLGLRLHLLGKALQPGLLSVLGMRYTACAEVFRHL